MRKQNLHTTVAASLCGLSAWLRGFGLWGGIHISTYHTEEAGKLKHHGGIGPKFVCMHVCQRLRVRGRSSGEWLKTACTYCSLLERLEFGWWGSPTWGQLQLVIKAASRKRLSKHGLLFCYFKQVIVPNRGSCEPGRALNIHIFISSLVKQHLEVPDHLDCSQFHENDFQSCENGWFLCSKHGNLLSSQGT